MLIICGKAQDCPQIIHENKANINSGLIIGLSEQNVLERFVLFRPQLHSVT